MNPTGPKPQMPQQQPVPQAPKVCPQGLKGPNCDVLDVR
jgi:hypothetical protein